MTTPSTSTRTVIKLEDDPPSNTSLNKPKEAFLNPEYSDIKIICGEKTFQAHKVIVCIRCQWFKTACEGSSEEPLNEIHVDDQNPILVERVLEFLYKGEYIIGTIPADARLNENESGQHKRKRTEPEITNRTLARCPPSYFHAQMFLVADYFKLGDLKAQAVDKFDQALTICNRPWKLELIIKELWSNKFDYTPLKQRLLNRLTTSQEKVRAVFWELTPDFFEKAPLFAVDFCSHYTALERQRLAPARSQAYNAYGKSIVLK